MTTEKTEKEKLEEELAEVRASIRNIINSKVEQYAVYGGKSFIHLRIKDLEKREASAR